MRHTNGVSFVNIGPFECLPHYMKIKQGSLSKMFSSNFRYYFKVQAKNPHGYGPVSPSVSFITESGTGDFMFSWVGFFFFFLKNK